MIPKDWKAFSLAIFCGKKLNIFSKNSAGLV